MIFQCCYYFSLFSVLGPIIWYNFSIINYILYYDSNVILTSIGYQYVLIASQNFFSLSIPLWKTILYFTCYIFFLLFDIHLLQNLSISNLTLSPVPPQFSFEWYVQYPIDSQLYMVNECRVYVFTEAVQFINFKNYENKTVFFFLIF